MTNGEKYKSAEERTRAFVEFCNADAETGCNGCRFRERNSHCEFMWLELEAEDEKLEPCPFCGEECACGGGYVECLNDNCCYSSGNRNRSDAEAVAAHNRVARAVKEKGEGK